MENLTHHYLEATDLIRSNTPDGTKQFPIRLYIDWFNKTIEVSLFKSSYSCDDNYVTAIKLPDHIDARKVHSTCKSLIPVLKTFQHEVTEYIRCYHSDTFSPHIKTLTILINQHLIFPEFDGPGLISIDDYFNKFNINFGTINGPEMTRDEVVNQASTMYQVARSHPHHSVIIGGNNEFVKYYDKTHALKTQPIELTVNEVSMMYTVMKSYCGYTDPEISSSILNKLHDILMD
jgi:hypothetical protein